MTKNKKLAALINSMARADQAMRKRIIAEHKKTDKKLDRNNTRRLKVLIQQYGWPTISLVGKKASHNAWLLVQHADQDIKFQKSILVLMKSIYTKKKNEILPGNIAYLSDRILIHEGKKQVFGTQFRQNKNGVFVPFPIKNKRIVNILRKRYGLTTLVENTVRINKEWKRLDGK